MSDEPLFSPVRDDAPVDIVPYDARWPDQVDAERALLLIAVGQWMTGPVEHIGSTAVPGLSAKPTIDIMAGVESLEASRAALPILETYEYRYAPYRTDVMHWFCKPSPAVRTYHTCTWSRSGAASGRTSSLFATICARTPRWQRNTRR